MIVRRVSAVVNRMWGEIGSAGDYLVVKFMELSE